MFGKFEHIEAFLDSYTRAQAKQQMDNVHHLSLDEQLSALKAAAVADIVEVKATITERQPDDLSQPKHYQMIIVLDQIIQATPDIKAELQQSEKEHQPVFVAIRYGDRMGLTQPITTGMNKGDKMHFKGQWISKDKAYSHGGAKMAVLHFTHHPIGFTCTIQKCYS